MDFFSFLDFFKIQTPGTGFALHWSKILVQITSLLFLLSWELKLVLVLLCAS